jgi:hypothetical protein
MDIPGFTFDVVFPYALAKSASSVIGYILLRAIYRLLRGGG